MGAFVLLFGRASKKVSIPIGEKISLIRLSHGLLKWQGSRAARGRFAVMDGDW